MNFPDINKTGLNAVNRLVDVIAYLSVEFHAMVRVKDIYILVRHLPCLLDQDINIFKRKSSLGILNLLMLLLDSIEKEIADGVGVTDNTNVQYDNKARSFDEVMNEAKELWMKLTVNNNTQNVEKIGTAIQSAFGHMIKLSEVKESQLEPLEVVIAEMKNM